MLALNQRGAGILDFTEGTWVVGIGLGTNGLEWLGQPLVGMRHQCVVILTGHGDIHIIIPGNKALVAHCTQHGACPEIIAQVVFLTYFIDGLKNLQDVELKGTDIVTCHINYC